MRWLLVLPALCLGLSGHQALAQDDAVKKAERIAVYRDLENLRQVYFQGGGRNSTAYRQALAQLLRSSDQVFLSIVDFDDENFVDKPSFKERMSYLEIKPYGKFAKILSTKELDPAERTGILGVLADDLALPKKEPGGAFCHYPIHGIRVYKAGILVYENTFCWVCHNYQLNLPDASYWVETSAEMYKAFNENLPVPPEELERFQQDKAGGEKKKPK